MRPSVMAVVTMLLVVTACGDDDAGPVFTTAAPGGTGDTTVTSTASGGSTSTSSASSDSTVTTSAATTTTTEAATLTALLTEPVPPSGGPLPESFVGSSEPHIESRLTEEIAASSGLDLTGVEFFVFSIADSNARMLVMDIASTATGLLEDTSGDALLSALVGAPVLTEAEIHQFVMHYHDADEQGPFTLSATIPWADLVAGVLEGAETGDLMQLQLTRDGS